MKPIKGLNLNTLPENQPKESYSYGKNGIQFDLEGSVTNEPGFRKIADSIIPAGNQCVGILSTDSPSIIIFYTDNTNSGVIRYNVETETIMYQFNDALTTYLLGFHSDYYITGEVQRNYIGELICAFTDKRTFPKFINLDKPVTNFLRDWNLFPEATYPDLDINVVSGGILTSGSYYIAGRYYRQDGTKTSFSAVSHGVATISDTGDDISDKAIQVQITNFDLSYDFFEIAVISKIKGVTSAKVLTKIPVVPGLYTTIFTGEGIFQDVSLEEVLVKQIFYDKVGTIGQLNDALYLGNLEKTKDIYNMQKYANMVKPIWKSELIDVANCPDEHKFGIKKSFKHGEVYALYIRYRLKNGSFTIAYSIPGPKPAVGDLILSSVGTVGGLSVGEKFKVEDIITVFSSSTKTGVAGPYQNSTETYPNIDDFNSAPYGGEDLRSQQVRHHKLPSLKWCKENLYASEAEYGVTKMDLLGIELLNVIIPTEYVNEIDGYELLYAKRTLANTTIYGQSLLLYGSYMSDSIGTNLDTSHVFGVGHNYNVKQTSSIGFRLDQTHMRFHAFDMLFNRPTVKPAFVSSQYKLEAPIETKYLSWSYPTGGTAASSVGNCVNLVDMMSGTSSNSPANNVNAVIGSKFLNNNIDSGEYFNAFLETSYANKLAGTPMPMPSLGTIANDSSSQGNFSSGSTCVAYLADLCDIKDNLYDSFYTQELISAGNAKSLTATEAFWGGDIFLSQYTFHTYGIMDEAWASFYDDGTNVSAPEMRGRRVVNRVICETVGNLYARYEIVGNIYSKWHPHNFLPTWGTTGSYQNIYPAPYSGADDPNQFGYNKGSEAINDFIDNDIFNPYRVYQTKFPYRIHRGGKLSRQNTRSWRTFLPLDFYECQKNMGQIIHLEGMEDRLLIHCENALFATQDKTKLESGLLSVTLGTADIFQFEPQEVENSKLGYAGTQHDLACVRTPIGYIFPDAKQGEFFLYKEKKLSSVNSGLHRFLREYGKVLGKNTFSGNGITIGWDQKYKRFLGTVRNLLPIDYTSAVIINNWSDIETVPADNSLHLKDGRVVFIGTTIYIKEDNRYLVYNGLLADNPDITQDCPPDTIVCDPPSSLNVVSTISPAFLHYTWVGTGNFYWKLCTIDNLGNFVLVQDGTTSSTFKDFDNTVVSADKVYYFQVTRLCVGGSSTPIAIIVSIPSVPDVIVTPPGETIVMYHVLNLPSDFHKAAVGMIPGCGIPSKGNVAKINIKVNGTYIGSNLPVSVTPNSCYYLSWSNSWVHGTQVGPSWNLSTPGSLTSATVVMEMLDTLGNPAVYTGGISPQPMLTTALVPVNGVVSGSNNHIITWTGVDISPAFTSYVHLYLS